MISEHQIDLILQQRRMPFYRRLTCYRGFRPIDKNQADLFPVEKMKEQVRLSVERKGRK